jgi:hypothetical protein
MDESGRHIYDATRLGLALAERIVNLTPLWL